MFSDTLLIYDPGPAAFDENQMPISVMWLCEFAQDLMYRLISSDIHFRALLTVGEFKSSDLNNFRYFFGGALVDTYLYEKKIESTGLYMHKSLVPYSNIFKTAPYDSSYSFVFLTQNLNFIAENFAHNSPSDMAYIVRLEGLEWLYVYDFVYLKNIYTNMNNTDLLGSVRTKYLNTWHMLSVQYGQLLSILVANNFDPRCIIDLDWNPWILKVKNKQGFHG
ncbi:MAG: hypothetical protein D3910_10420 [Candidatus Electrothrix sp. ATG2]|nr:hypothetical protein [Candidatus Electrothrix sp. ATG2]